MKGLKNVRAEFSLSCVAYNLRRVITILGVPRRQGPSARNGIEQTCAPGRPQGKGISVAHTENFQMDTRHLIPPHPRAP